MTASTLTRPTEVAVTTDVAAPTIEVITPEKAQQWLDTANIHNRKMRRSRVDGYARDIAAGLWKFNGAPYIFNNQGAVVDGQHRLAAIVAAGIPVVGAILRNVDPDVQKTVDIGAPRSAGDTLLLNGETNAKELATVVKQVIRFRAGFMPASGAYSISTAAIDERLDDDTDGPRAREAARIAVKARNDGMRCPTGTLGAAWFLVSELDEVDANDFIVNQVIDGIELKRIDPAYALRRRIEREAATRAGRMNANDLLGFSLQAWSHHRRRNTIQKLQAPHGKTGWGYTDVVKFLI